MTLIELIIMRSKNTSVSRRTYMNLTNLYLKVLVVIGLILIFWQYQRSALTYNARSALKQSPRRRFVLSHGGFTVTIIATFVFGAFLIVYTNTINAAQTLTQQCVSDPYPSVLEDIDVCVNRFGYEIFLDQEQAFQSFENHYNDELPANFSSITINNIKSLSFNANSYLTSNLKYLTTTALNAYNFHTNVSTVPNTHLYLVDNTWLIDIKPVAQKPDSTDITFVITNTTSIPQTFSAINPILITDGTTMVSREVLEPLNVTIPAHQEQSITLTIPLKDQLSIRINAANQSWIHQGGQS